MVRLREKLNPEEKQGALGGPTKFETETNRHGLHCRECGEFYYVDEFFYGKVRAALELDPSENSFVCEDCEAEYGEQEYSH
jgi:Zn finger protein HypA/HybF involved in hydrogenase expression